MTGNPLTKYYDDMHSFIFANNISFGVRCKEDKHVD
jgi:hypothetical protein